MYLRQSTSQVIRFGPFLDSTDGVTAETGLTIAQADMQLSKDGGAFAQKNTTGNATHDADGWYSTTLDTTDTATVGELYMQVNVTGALPVWVRYWVLEETVYDAMFAASATGYVASSDLPSNFGDLAITASTGRVTAGTVSDKTGYSISGTKTTLDDLNDLSAADVNAQCDAALVDYDALVPADLPANFGDLSITATTGRVDVGFVSGTAQTANDNGADINAILTDTNELQTDWADGGRLDLILDARASQATADNIETDTQGIQATLASGVDVASISGSTEAADNLQISAEVIVPGTAQTGTLSTTQMSTNLTEATDDHYNGRTIIWTSGVLQDQATDITDYNGTSKVLTFTAVTEAPSNGDTFAIV